MSRTKILKSDQIWRYRDVTPKKREHNIRVLDLLRLGSAALLISCLPPNSRHLFTNRSLDALMEGGAIADAEKNLEMDKEWCKDQS